MLCCSSRLASRLLSLVLLATAALAANPPDFQRIKYNNPALRTDVGVGLWGWPLPLDYNGDGLMDLVVVCSGKPYNGTYLFENSGVTDPEGGLPLLKAGVRLGRGIDSAQISYVDGKPVVLTAGAIYPHFTRSALEQPQKLNAPSVPEIFGATDANLTKPDISGIRSSQWTEVDYDGDGKRDLIVGIDYWGDYKWRTSNQATEPAFDENGKWKFGPLHGYVYLLRNTGTNEVPSYAKPIQLKAGDAAIDVYGRPSPCFGDFRGTGKLDLICGEFIDGFTYFENIGTRTEPRYAPGRRLALGGVPLTMDLCMIAPVACDFNGDGHLDLVVGQEDGRVALLQNTGKVADGMPQFLPPRFFRQLADEVKFGVLSAPSAVDLDGDGLEDLVVGNSAGYVGFIKNLGGDPVRWAAPVYLAADGQTIHIQAGYNGDCQGPSETKWGYTDVCAADWDMDGLPDIMCSDVWGKVYWYRNIGTRTEPRFAAAAQVEVEWPGKPPKPAWNWWEPHGKELVIEWRCTPYVIDWNHDGLPDLVTLDHEGYLALFERRKTADGRLQLLPGKRVFRGEGVSSFDSIQRPTNHQSGLLQLNSGLGGSSGRRTFCFVDWDGDGVLDLLVNSVNVNFLKGLGQNSEGQWTFKDMGPLNPGQILAGHSTAPTVVHWTKGKPGEVLFGTEDGFLYLIPHGTLPQ
ncbi:VCBS repeat-containing protein [Horticoccus luteus]|uniref:VCBS repeat-containing protein n=1 Tax=Horticoccus luteus TaxID=2862869 RepID=A0A8F9XKL2_9BACT|nr:VCBS repeat-containing protein [Horticoccus luteus]QYM78174.1 VCBS repeat-containing protein [Horticoccus luteus]